MKITVEKRFLSLILSFILVLSLVPASVIEVCAEQTFNVSVLDGKIKVHDWGNKSYSSGSQTDGVITSNVQALAQSDGGCPKPKYTYTSTSHTI